MVVPEIEEGVEMGGFVANENDKPLTASNDPMNKV
jgi:hypothetical protein